MTMKTKLLLWAALSFTFPSVADQSQAIRLADGTKLTFLGLTSGRHHVAPKYENLAAGNWIYTPDNTTVAWVEAEHDPAKWPDYELLIYDKAKTACISTEKRASSHVKSGVDIQGFVLNAFPRRNQGMILRARPYHGAIGEGQFVFTNTTPGSFPDWKTEAFPDTKSDGDLEITLTNLTAAAPKPRFPKDHVPENDPANHCVRLAFGINQNQQPVTNWNPWMVYTSDSTGNRVQSAVRGYPVGGIYNHPTRDNPQPDMRMDGYYYVPGLWPSEPWKVRLEFTRTSGFNDDEILTFTNLPVRVGTQEDADREWAMNAITTNVTFMPGTASGVQMKLLTPLLFPDQQQNGQKFIRVLLFTDLGNTMVNPVSQGLRLTLIEATDDQGRTVWSPFSPAWAGHFSLEFPHARENIKTLNLKLALHKSRFVEFTVKPGK